jgi:hypothetical protein
MAMVFTDAGIDAVFKAYFNNDFPVDKDLTLKLFATNVTPTQTTVAGDLTEASGGGYAAKTLTNGSWTVTPANDPSDVIYAVQTWTFTGALTTNGTIYGYYVVDDDGTLLWAELLDVAYTPTANGDQLLITPKVEGSSGTPA